MLTNGLQASPGVLSEISQNDSRVIMFFSLGCKMILLPLMAKLNSQTDKTEEVRRLGMGRLLEDLSRKMQHKAIYGSQDPLKILVHSTHDMAIAGLCSTVDLFADRSVTFFLSCNG